MVSPGANPLPGLTILTEYTPVEESPVSDLITVNELLMPVPEVAS